jgi:hypothetical protein
MSNIACLQWKIKNLPGYRAGFPQTMKNTKETG